MNQTFHLYQLQKIDRQLLALEKRLAEIESVIQNDRRLVEVDNEITRIVQKMDKTKRELRALEEQAKSIRVDIETDEASLYSGNIRNPKELNDLQLKINMQRKNQEKNEEAQLELLMTIEQQEADLEAWKANRIRVESETATDHALLLGERSQLLKQKETLETERSAKCSSVDETILNVYTKLFREKRSLAVALVEDLACTACGAPLTPGERQAMRASSSLSFCTSCGRILYVS